MLTGAEDVEVHALHKQGWTISAIARHTGRNRRTIRNYINGVTTPGVRKPAREARSGRSSSTSPAGWPRIRTCGLAPCATSSKSSGTGCRIPR